MAGPYRPMSPKGPELTPKEYETLRAISQHLVVAKQPLLQRLKTLGFIDEKPDGWALTQSGHILLMFNAAR